MGIDNDDGVGLIFEISLAVIFQFAMMRRVGQDLAYDRNEFTRALDIWKQLFLDNMLFVGMPRGDRLGDFQLSRGRLFLLRVFVPTGVRGWREIQRERAHRDAKHQWLFPHTSIL